MIHLVSTSWLLVLLGLFVSDVKVKNKMLEYLADIMEDAQDFSWV